MWISFLDLSLIIEICLIGLAVALIGAGGYVFFVFSLKDDLDAKRMECSDLGPWEQLCGDNEKAPPKKQNKRKVVALSVAAVLAVLFFLFLSFHFGWIAV